MSVFEPSWDSIYKLRSIQRNVRNREKGTFLEVPCESEAEAIWLLSHLESRGVTQGYVLRWRRDGKTEVLKVDRDADEAIFDEEFRAR